MKCYFCGELVDENTSDVHHLTKRSKGGQDHAQNIRRICTRCHRLIHVCEKMLTKGRPDSVVLDYLTSFLSGFQVQDVQKTARALLTAATEAAFSAESAARIFVPVEVRVPTKMHEELKKKAVDLHISRNDLILWAISELLAGRVLLPNKKQK